MLYPVIADNSGYRSRINGQCLHICRHACGYDPGVTQTVWSCIHCYIDQGFEDITIAARAHPRGSSEQSIPALSSAHFPRRANKALVDCRTFKRVQHLTRQTLAIVSIACFIDVTCLGYSILLVHCFFVFLCEECDSNLKCDVDPMA